MSTKKGFLILILLIFSRGSWAQEESPLPKIPKSGKEIQDFIPQGWEMLGRDEGDLNKDGLDDFVLALRNKAEEGEDNKTEDLPRLLIILFRTPQGGLRLSASSDRALLCQKCGGVFGDPFQEVTVEKGAVVIKHFGGSTARWASVNRFRYQKGEWFLIGKTYSTQNVFSKKGSTTDSNLLTGIVIQEKVSENGRSSRAVKKLPNQTLPRLVDFSFDF